MYKDTDRLTIAKVPDYKICAIKGEERVKFFEQRLDRSGVKVKRKVVAFSITFGFVAK